MINTLDKRDLVVYVKDMESLQQEISRLSNIRSAKILLNKKTWLEIQDLNKKLKKLRVKRDRLATLIKWSHFRPS